MNDPISCERATPAPLEQGEGEIRAYFMDGGPYPEIVPAPVARDWMTRSPDASAMTCRPTKLANQHGWLILNPSPFVVEWDGGWTRDSLTLRHFDGSPPYLPRSVFGEAILTFVVPYVFRTPPGIGLLVRGPSNYPIDGASPLEGLLETDWTSPTVLMNWMITRPHEPIYFAEGIPVGMIVPVMLDLAESLRPAMQPLRADLDVSENTGTRVARVRNTTIGIIRGDKILNSANSNNYGMGRTEFGEPSETWRARLHLKPFDVPKSICNEPAP